MVDLVCDHFHEMMSDSYGNYFCQTLVRTVGIEQRLKLLRALKLNFVEVSCSVVGTHSMQRLVEVLCQIDEKTLVYESLLEHIESLAFDPKGNYVLISVMQILKT